MMKEANPKSRKVPLSTKFFWDQLCQGFNLFAIAGIQFIHSLWGKATLMLVMLGLLGLTIFLSELHTDKFDEMALANQQQAKAKTLDIMKFVLVGIPLALLVLSDLSPNLLPRLLGHLKFYELSIGLVGLILGLQSIMTGLIFRKLEEN